MRVDANPSAINALGVQTAARFDRLEQRFDRLEDRVDGLDERVGHGFARTDQAFAEIRGQLDQTAAGQQQIVDLLTTLIAERDDQ
jgi:hypothetical protein